MTVRRWIVRCAVALAVVAATARVAGAHAVLLHTQPETNTTVAAGPTRIQLSFNERVEPILNSIRVIDREGRRRDRGSAVVLGDKSLIEVEVDAIDPGPLHRALADQLDRRPPGTGIFRLRGERAAAGRRNDA